MQLPALNMLVLIYLYVAFSITRLLVLFTSFIFVFSSKTLVCKIYWYAYNVETNYVFLMVITVCLTIALELLACCLVL